MRQLPSMSEYHVPNRLDAVHVDIPMRLERLGEFLERVRRGIEASARELLRLLGRRSGGHLAPA
jgi:hypothetical protein